MKIYPKYKPKFKNKTSEMGDFVGVSDGFEFWELLSSDFIISDFYEMFVVTRCQKKVKWIAVNRDTGKKFENINSLE